MADEPNRNPTADEIAGMRWWNSLYRGLSARTGSPGRLLEGSTKPLVISAVIAAVRFPAIVYPE